MKIKKLLILPMLLAMVGVVLACYGEDCSETNFNLNVESYSDDVSISTYVGTYDTEIATNLNVYNNDYTGFSQEAYVEDCYNDGWFIDTWGGVVYEEQSAYAYGEDISYSRDVSVYSSEESGWFMGEDNYYSTELEAFTPNAYFNYDIEGSGYSYIHFDTSTDDYLDLFTGLNYGYNGWCFMWGCN